MEHVYFWTETRDASAGKYIPRDKFPAKLDIDLMWDAYDKTVRAKKSDLDSYKKKIKGKIINRV